MKHGVEKVQFPNWFRRLRLRQQILCIQSLSSLLVLGLLALSLYLLFYYGQEKISDIAEKILIEKILLRFSSRIVKYYQTRILQGFEECSDQLTYINQLYHFTIENQLQFNYDVDQALLQNYTSYNPEIVWNSQFSYGIFGNQNTSFNEQDKLKLSNILTEIQSLIPRKATLFFVGLSDIQYFSALPGNYFYKYVPHSRPWYAHHFTEYTYEKFPFSDPYGNFFGGIIITRTGNLTNLNNQLVGITGNDMNITSFWGLNNIENAEIYLIDDEGRLILSPHYSDQQTEVDYIYDVRAIGFNQTDYKIIIQEIEQPNQVCSFQLESFFCLENKINNKTYYLNTYPIKRYRVIMRFEKEEYENQLKKLQAIKNKLQTYNSQFEFIIGGVAMLIFIALQWLTSSILSTPLERIMYCTKLVMTNNELPSIIQNLVTMGRSDQIDKLSKAFQNLIRMNRRRKSKGKQYQQLNNYIGFPQNINIAYLKYDLINYKKFLSELQDRGRKQLTLVKKCLKFHNWKKSF